MLKRVRQLSSTTKKGRYGVVVRSGTVPYIWKPGPRKMNAGKGPKSARAKGIKPGAGQTLCVSHKPFKGFIREKT